VLAKAAAPSAGLDRVACRRRAAAPYVWRRICDRAEYAEVTMILVELLFALMLAGVVLLIFPLLVLLASVLGIVLLWVLAPTVLIAALVLWLLFPHFAGLALLILVLVVGFWILDRRYPRAPVRHWP
jgi:hypothetical protein